ncbi:hypothetical protein LCGC14_1201550, partial [marine sediment metagenome]
MELLEYPDKDLWEKRNKWIEDEIDNSILGGYAVSDHAAALFLDLQACYCIGAWLSVIILSISVLDAHLRETESGDNKIGTAKLLNDFYNGTEDINRLRRLRNKYVHLDLDKPILQMNAQF